MLCPQCGADVGDNIHLCANCEARRKERLAAEAIERGEVPESDAAAEGSDSEDGIKALPLPESVEEAREKSNTIRNIGIGFVLFVVLLGGKIVLRQMSAVEHQPVGTGGGGSQSSVPAQTSASPTPAPSSANTGSPYLGETRSGLRIGRAELRLKAGLALYHRQTRTLEIAFFREWSEPIDDGVLRRQGTLETVQGVHPDALLTLNFRDGDSTCGLGAVNEYRLTLFKKGAEFPIASDRLAFPVKSISGELGSGVTTAFESLRCVFEDKAKINGTFRGGRQIAVRDETQSISWELVFDLPLIGPKTGAELDFDSKDAKSSMALWNAAKSELAIGFFGEELSAAEKERIRRSGGYDYNTEKKPDVVLTFNVVPGKHDLNVENLKTFGVLFFRDRTRGYDFPGLDSQVGAFYVGNAQNGGKLEGLSGELADRASIAGSYQHSASKRVGVSDVKMHWNLQFHVPVMDTAAHSDAALEAPRENAGSEAGDKSPFGTISVDDDQVQIASVIPLYYSSSGDLSVGFYVDQLTAEEREEVVKRRTLSTYVNRKRPSLILTLDFDEERTSVSRQELKSYTMFFYREAGGAFNFPGFHDVVSIKRMGEQIPADEILTVSGALKPGSKVKLRLKGQGQVPGNPAEFRWDVSYDLEPIVLK